MTAARQRGAASKRTWRTLFGLAKGVGMTSDEAKLMASALTGKDDLKEFTQQDIDEVCYELMRRKDLQQHQANRITYQQLYRIKQLVHMLGWDDDPARLKGQILRDYHVDDISWLTIQQAAGLMCALENMYDCKPEKEAAPNA